MFTPDSVYRNQEIRLGTVIQADATNRICIMRDDKFNSLIQVSLHLHDDMAVFPAVGEKWSVNRRGGTDWFLGKRMDTPTEPLPFSNLKPGDRRISTSGDLYIIANEIVISGTLINSQVQDLTTQVQQISESIGITTGGTTTTTTTQTRDLIVVIDGGGLQLSTGIKGEVTIDFDATITQWTLLADQVGSIAVSIWETPYSRFPPTVSDKITNGTPPKIISAAKGQSSVLNGWTTSIVAGNTLRFNVDSVSSLTRATLILKLTQV